MCVFFSDPETSRTPLQELSTIVEPLHAFRHALRGRLQEDQGRDRLQRSLRVHLFAGQKERQGQRRIAQGYRLRRLLRRLHSPSKFIYLFI